MARIIRRNPGEVGRFLRSTEMQRAMGRIADDMAAAITRAASPTYPAGLPAPRVSVTPNGGVRRDRAMGTVIVPAPAPADIRYPDVKGRFRVIQGAVTALTRGSR
jgi:hypothetical protein